MLTLKKWCNLDLFTGINVFIDWCEKHQFDHSDPEVFELFKTQLKK